MKPVLRLSLCLLIALLTAAALPAQADPPQDKFVYFPLMMNRSIRGPLLAGCPVFPGDNVWNTPVDWLPADAAKTAAYINTLGANTAAHPFFGAGQWAGGPIGFPFVVVPQGQPKVTIHYTAYGSESDPGPMPIPADAPIENGPNSIWDRHVLVVEQGTCKLYELYRAFPQPDGSWNAESGAVYDLRANGPLRPLGWTSADGAGLPMLPGLARYEEVEEGVIRHALRVTVSCTQHAYIWPARHLGGMGSTNCPPMGQRLRLKADVDISGAPYQAQVVLQALKKYGMLVTDNGSSWHLSGAPDERWDNNQLYWIDQHIKGQDFEVVDGTSLMISLDSGEARQP